MVFFDFVSRVVSIAALHNLNNCVKRARILQFPTSKEV